MIEECPDKTESGRKSFFASFCLCSVSALDERAAHEILFSAGVSLDQEVNPFITLSMFDSSDLWPTRFKWATPLFPVCISTQIHHQTELLHPKRFIINLTLVPADGSSIKIKPAIRKAAKFLNAPQLSVCGSCVCTRA